MTRRFAALHFYSRQQRSPQRESEMLWFNRKTTAVQVAEPPQAAPVAAMPNRAHGNETIIIADDDRLVRSALCAALRRLGYRVLEASSGAQAVQIAETETGPIDMVLADVVMPSMTTDQLHQRLHQAKPEARIAFMSGYT